MSTQPLKREHWLGFYTSRPFWAGAALDVRAATVLQNFTDSMSEITLSYDREGVAVNICKDGMILLRLAELEARIAIDNDMRPIEASVAFWNEYLNLANVYYLLLDCSLVEISKFAYFQLSEITNRDAFRCIFENGREVGQSIASESFSSQLQMDRYRSISNPERNTRLLHRPSIHEQVFEHCFDRFVPIVRNTQLVKRLSDLAKSVSEYKIGNYPVSLVNAWFVCEREISDRWQTFIDARATTFDDGRGRLNAERRKFLTGRDFTASVMSNILELADVITYDDLQTLDQIRRARNAIAHSLGSNNCDARICQSAIEIASRLALTHQPFDLRLNLGYSVSGI